MLKVLLLLAVSLSCTATAQSRDGLQTAVPHNDHVFEEIVTTTAIEPPDPMQLRPAYLINATEMEAWPAWLLRARGNRDARALSQAQWVLRLKKDGRYLGTIDKAGNVAALGQGIPPRLRAEAADLAASTLQIPQPAPPPETPGLPQRLARLGIAGEAYAERTALPEVQEPARLRYAGRDRYGRVLWLKEGAAQAWIAMQQMAKVEGVALDAVSGYRSHAYQQGIFERKRQTGQKLDEILRANAAPGFSEHHGGCAIDIGTRGQPPAEESFEKTGAFAWLQLNASAYGFHMSYPRDNPHGIVYEPWHWCWREQDPGKE